MQIKINYNNEIYIYIYNTYKLNIEVGPKLMFMQYQVQNMIKKVLTYLINDT